MRSRGTLSVVLLFGAMTCQPAVGTTATPPLTKLQQQSAAGNPAAEVKLGLALAASKDKVKEVAAITLFRKAYAQGDPDGAWWLGNAYEMGIGAPKNLTKAKHLMRAGINRSGSRMVAYALQLPSLDRGSGRSGYTARAHWLQRAAKSGSPLGMAMLATFELVGTQGIPKNPAASRQWFLRAAQAGNVNAEVILGEGTILGGFGAGTANVDQGLHWLRLAAKSGNGQAEGLLGILLSTGQHGVPEDALEGLKWAVKAAHQHNALGYMVLGAAEQQGFDKKSADPAAALFDFAAARRTDTAHRLSKASLHKHISAVESTLSQAQISEILAKAAKVSIPKHGDSEGIEVKTIPPGWEE